MKQQLHYSSSQIASILCVLIVLRTQHDCSLTSSTTHKRISLQFANIIIVPRAHQHQSAVKTNKLRTLAVYQCGRRAARTARHESICGVKMFDKRPPLSPITIILLFLKCVLLSAQRELRQPTKPLMSDMRVIYFKREKLWRCQIANCSEP